MNLSHQDTSELKYGDGHLELLNNTFGWVVKGTNPNLQTSRPMRTDQVLFVKCMRTNAITKIPMIGEDLGVVPPKRCHKCKSCNDCSDTGVLMLRKEEQELVLIKESIKLDLKEGSFDVRYPLDQKRAPFLMDNHDQVIAIQK